MKNIKKYEIKIVSETPVIWNRMKKENEDEKQQVKKNEMKEWEENNWLKKAETNNGNAIMPTSWIKSMLLNACKGTMLVPHFATDKRTTYTRYFGSVLIPSSPPIILAKVTDLTQHGGYYPPQGVKKTGTKVWKVFPTLKKWSATFTLVDPFGRMKKEELNELMEFGGMFIGVGDQRKMNFGRFDIDYIKEIKE